MQLKAFRVINFRSVMDSTWIDVDKITNIIGVNESGKSNVLLALWKLHPVNDGDINLLEDLPREMYAQMKDDCETKIFVETKWDLAGDKYVFDVISKYVDISMENCSELYFARNYGGEYICRLDKFEKEYKNKLEHISKEISSKRIEIKNLLEDIVSDDGMNNIDAERFNTLIKSLSDGERVDHEDLQEIFETIKSHLSDETSTEKDALLNLLDEYIELSSQINVYHSDEFKDELINHIPHFVYYSNYGNLDSEIYLPYVINDLDRTDLSGHAAAKARTLKMLFSFIKLNPRNILELGRDTLLQNDGKPYSNPSAEQLKNFGEKKRERTVLLDSASAKLTKEFRNWWKQGQYQFDLKADGNFFKIWVSDSVRPAKIELESRSTGLQWFLSFYITFLVETEGPLHDSVILLDEAGLSLHPMAQKDLIAFFKELSNTNQIIHTTHSPFLVDTSNIDNVKLAYIDENGHTVLSSNLRASNNSKQSKAIYAVHAALGLTVSDILLHGCIPVIVEGVSDQYYLNTIKNYLISIKKISQNQEIVFIPVGGIKGIKPVASIITGVDQALPYVIVDSDEQGKNYKKKLISDLYKDDKARIIEIKDITGIENSEVEDLIPYSCLERGFDRLLRDVDDDEFHPIDNMPIIPQFEKFASENEIVLETGYKVQLARNAKSKILELDKTDGKVRWWENLFKRIK